ncbi:MAG: tRNA pseudouridine(38-40) synthase TruA [Planctomycetota bacterium]|jgi:tRNA pseudouridine38-40 synthase|nr:tRNA pseudouridine(38-40) synthase TruA [Planctomycetota bacterium]
MTPLCRASVEYDGTAYSGWQIQNNAPSIQAELEGALARLTGQACRVRGAGRTDAGVHARGQTATFPAPPGVPEDKVAETLNSRLPPDIAVTRSVFVPDTFDPRRDCLRKQYSYTFSLGNIRPALERCRSWHIKKDLDLAAMREAASFFIGQHDFTSFCNQELAEADNVLDLDRSEILFFPPDAAGRQQLVYLVEARSFRYNMVRIIAGTLAEVGMGRFSPDNLPGILDAHQRKAAGQSAPPWGLCLEWTLYPGDPGPKDRLPPGEG